MATQRVQIPIRFEADAYEWLRRQAFERRSKINVIVREAVDEARKAGKKKGVGK
jgi:hypothetical protein